MGQFAPSSPVPAGKLHPAKSPRWLRIFHRRWQSSSAIKVCMSVCEGERESERERKRERERERESEILHHITVRYRSLTTFKL